MSIRKKDQDWFDEVWEIALRERDKTIVNTQASKEKYKENFLTIMQNGINVNSRKEKW